MSLLILSDENLGAVKRLLRVAMPEVKSAHLTRRWLLRWASAPMRHLERR